MTVRKTFQWTIVLVAMIAAGGWYAVRYAFDHKDRLVLEGIRQDLARRMPDWGVTIADAHCDLHGRVMLEDVKVQPDPQQPPLLTIPKCLVMLDADLLLEQKQVFVQSIRWINPQVLFARDASGRWNWHGLSRPADSGQTPEVTIEQGQLIVDLSAADGVPATQIASRSINMRLIPSGTKRYLIQGASEIDGAGALNFGGQIDFNTGAWRMAGSADQIEMSQGLLEQAAALAPDMGRKVAELSGGNLPAAGETATPGIEPYPHAPGHSVPVRTAGLERPVASGQLSLPNLGLSASVGFDFDVSSDGKQTVPDYRVLARVVNGTVTQPLSPVPLSNLNGELLVENDRVVIHEFSASNGGSQLKVSGQIAQVEGQSIRDFEIVAERLLIDQELRHLLPPAGQRLFDKIRPGGLFTVRGRFRDDGEGKHDVRLDEFTALDCTMQHELFAYPITGIQGTVKQQEDALVLDLQGLASGRTVSISGTVTNPGPEAEATIGVEVDNLPIDERFRNALVDPKHAPARKALQMLNLTGVGDLRLVFHRQAGAGQPTQMGLDADMRQGTLSYEKFPYTVTDVSGHIKFDPWREKIWRFTNLRGMHAATTIAGTASYDLTQPNGGLLDLLINASDVPLDKELHRATTTASPALQEVWLQLNPSASPPSIVQVENVHLTWRPGTTPIIELPSIHVDQATLTMPSFPFRWDHVTGDLSWKDGLVTIHQLSARHNETMLSIEGRLKRTASAQQTGTDAAGAAGEGTSPQLRPPAHFVVAPADGDGARWKLRLEDVKVRNLDPGPEFRTALPGDVASVVGKLNPRGPLDIDLGFELAAYPRPQGGPDLMTSQWKLRTRLLQDHLAVGVDLHDVTGVVTAGITCDGVHLTARGNLEFETARALDMTFSNIRAPFAVDDYRVTLGSPSMLQETDQGLPEPQVPPDEQLLASLYGGSVTINAEAQVNPYDGEQTEYRARIRFRDGDLQQWAREWQIGNAGINGIANGSLDLEGKGTSALGLSGKNCRMTITDARLGELPVIARMLAQMVAPQQRDSTAFTYAYLEFDIRDGLFDFGPTRGRAPQDTRRIVLSGDSLRMIGQGYVPFAPELDPPMSLDFYSKAPPNLLSAIPIIGPVTKSFSDNWIHVRVSGPPSQPQIRTQTEVPVDNALRQLFNALETGFAPTGPLMR